MPVDVLRADGGAAANPFLMQFQADILGCRVEVAAERDSTALGAAALAGLAVGVWEDTESLRPLIRAGAGYEPRMSRDEAKERLDGWKRASAARAVGSRRDGDGPVTGWLPFGMRVPPGSDP